MLSIFDTNPKLHRRELLTLGTLGLGGLSLSSLLGAQSSNTPKLTTGKSVIVLFQQGGPSQLETFDPKPEAPEGTRTVGDVIKTTLPGILFGERMSQLAKLAHKFNVVRSYQTNNGGHNIKPMVGPDTLDANIGTYYSRVVGATHPETGTPTNALLFPQSACEDVTKGKARGDFTATGQLGKQYAPFSPGGGGELQKNMKLNVPAERLSDRRALLGELDKVRRSVDAERSLDDLNEMQKQAYEVLLSGGVADALDLSKEDPNVLKRYDTSRYASKDGWKKVNRGKRGYYTGHAKSLGKLLLMARRLCEAGCGFVTVHASYDGVWDMHADGNNLNMTDGMEAIGPTYDHAVATFIQDLEARGLQDKIMLVTCGEMGRTPKINKRGGRDHWSRLAPLLVYGGGTKGGNVIGRSTSNGGEPASERITPDRLISTIVNTMLDVGQLRIDGSVPQINKLAESAPITELY